MHSYIILTSALLLLGFYIGLRYGKILYRRGIRAETFAQKGRVQSRVILTIFVVVGLCVFLYTRTGFLDKSPLFIQFYFGSISWFIMKFFFVFIFGFSVYLYSKKRGFEKVLLIFLGMFLLGSIQAFEVYTEFPIYKQLKHQVRDSDGTVCQTSQWSCAPAAWSMILQHYGVEMTEPEVAKLFGTNRLGTSAAQIVYGLKKIGFSARTRTISIEDLERLDHPVQLYIDFLNREDHAVVFWTVEDGFFIVLDPLRGRMKYRKAELATEWHGNIIEIENREKVINR